MNGISSYRPQMAGLERKKAIDAICDQFEEAWTSGANPRIESYLELVAPPEQRMLLRELLVVEHQLRQQAGQHPRREEYLGRFPQHHGVVTEVFDACAPDKGGSRQARLGQDFEKDLVRAVRERLGGEKHAERPPRARLAILTRSSELRFWSSDDQRPECQIWTLILRRTKLATQAAGSAALAGDMTDRVEACAQRVLDAFPATRRSILQSILLGSSIAEAAEHHQVTTRTVAMTYRSAVGLLTGK